MADEIVNADVVIGDVLNVTVDNVSETVTVTQTTSQEILNATIVPGTKGDKGDTGATGAAGADAPSDHTLLTNIGTNTHAQIDTAISNSVSHIANTSNPHGVTKAQVGLSNVPNTDFTADVAANTAKISFDAVSSARLANTSGTNTGDQDLSGYSLTSHNHTGVYAPVLGADDNYVTDAEKVVIGNTSGTNTGDNATNTQYSGLAASKQDADATLTSLAAYNTNGILTQTAADTFTGRTITGTANQINVTNGNGVSGNPTLSLPQNIHSGAAPTFAGATLNGDVATGLFLNNSAPNTNTAPQRISRINQNGRGIVNGIAAFSGFGDYFYCLDRNPTYTITTTGVTNVNAMFDNDPSVGADIAVANLGTTPAVIEIVRTDGGRISFTDVLTLIIVNHRLYGDESLTSYMVETKCSDGVWRTELDRTGVTDSVDGAISIPLHVYGATYAAGDNNGYHALHGIRLTIRGATPPPWNSGKFRIAGLQLRDSRPTFTPARGLGALDMRGGDMYGDIRFPSLSGTRLGWAGDKLSFYGATPIVRPTSTPANATDLATALTLVNDLKSKLVTLGLIA